MRTSTQNRLQMQWRYDPAYHMAGVNDADGSRRVRNVSACSLGHLMWTLPEIDSFRRYLGRAPAAWFPGSYYWPTYFDERDGSPSNLAGGFYFTVLGPTHTTDPDVLCTPISSNFGVPDVELFCKTKIFLCADANTSGNCPDYFPYKIGLSWEKSINGGVSWTTLDAPKVDFSSNQITIGQVNWPPAGTAAYDEDGQFYGIIDSVRLSVGTPRYTGDVIQPYARSGITYYEGFMASHFDGRQYPVADVIDEYVTFSVNLFDYKHIKYADPSNAVLHVATETLPEQEVAGNITDWIYTYTEADFSAVATEFRLDYDFFAFNGVPLVRYLIADNYFYIAPYGIGLPAYDGEANPDNTGFSEEVSFTKQNYGAEEDELIADTLVLARGAQYSLYNSATQSPWTGGTWSTGPQNPEGTEWALGWDNECDVAEKTFVEFSELWGGGGGNGVGQNIVGAELVLHHIETDRYWFIKFTSWTQGGNGGGFAYVRREFFGCIPPGTGAVPVTANNEFFYSTLRPALEGQYLTSRGSFYIAPSVLGFFVPEEAEEISILIVSDVGDLIPTYTYAWSFSLALVPPHVTWFTGEPAQWRTHMTPGSNRFPIYVRGRGFNGGYLFEGDPVHPAMSYSPQSANGLSDVLAPYFRRVTHINEVTAANIPEERKLLYLSNKSAGLFGCWPGVMFPSHEDFNGQVNAPSVQYAIHVSDSDFTPPATPEFAHISRVMTVDAASTRHVGKLAGNKIVLDGVQVADGMYVLIKDQDDPRENGIYEVRGLSAGVSLDWRRLRVSDTIEDDPLYDLYVRVEAQGKLNGGTNWYYSLGGVRPPDFGVDEVHYVRDSILGVYKEDFCFESWVKPASFLHPSASQGSSQDGVSRDGKRQTLVDTYMRTTQRDAVEPSSGFRVYFRPEENDDQAGRVCADFFYYHTDLNTTETTPPTFTNEEWAGPALVSDVIQANRFHHIALVRDGNTFSLYVNGIRQDKLFTQGKNWEPEPRSTDQNHEAFRIKSFYSRYVKVSRSIQLIVKLAEFTYKGEDSPEYAVNFNGAAGMIEREADRLINLPETWYYAPATMSDGECTGFATDIFRSGASPQPLSEYATWPGFPIPNYPYRHHVYIVNDITYSEDTGQAPYSFLFTPTLNFPIDTIRVDRATTPASAQDVYLRPLKHAGDIDLTSNNPPNIPPTKFYGTMLAYQNEGGQTITETLHIDGMPVVVGERILIKDQDDETENGIWIVSEQEWTRAEELDSADEIREQVRVLAYGGFINSGTGWNMVIDGAIKKIDYEIGVTPLVFEKDESITASQEQFECYVDRSVCRGQGVEVSDEPVVLVDEVAIAHVSLNGFPPASSLYSGNALTNGQHRILLLAQNNPVTNGVWLMNAGTWTRVEDLLYSEDYVARRAEAEFNEILFSPPTGDDQGCTYGFRCLLQHDEQFVLNVSEINPVSLTPTVLNKLHIPTTWLNLTIPGIQIDEDTGLPLIGSGDNVQWSDFIPTTDDKSVWRIRLKCANTEDYSRHVIVRMASNLGITLNDIYDQQVLPGDF